MFRFTGQVHIFHVLRRLQVGEIPGCERSRYEIEPGAVPGVVHVNEDSMFAVRVYRRGSLMITIGALDFRRISLPKSFNVMDRRLAEFIDMIRSLDRVVGLWNVDFMDYRNLVKKNPGLGFIGHGRGETIMKALEQSLRGQMLDVELYGAAGALLNIQACEETPMEKIVGTINEIKEEYGIADIKPGVVLREDLPEVLVVATRVRSKIVENILQGRIVYAEKNRV